MRILLQRLEEVLKNALTGDASSPVKLVNTRPQAYIAANLNALRFPSVFLWPDSWRFDRSERSNETLLVMMVSITCLFHSSDPAYAMFNKDKGVFGVTEQVFDVIAKNKKLKKPDGTDPIIAGVNLPMSSQFIEIDMDVGTGFAVGSISMIEFHQHGVPWTSLENSESEFLRENL